MLRAKTVHKNRLAFSTVFTTVHSLAAWLACGEHTRFLVPPPPYTLLPLHGNLTFKGVLTRIFDILILLL